VREGKKEETRDKKKTARVQKKKAVASEKGNGKGPGGKIQWIVGRRKKQWSASTLGAKMRGNSKKKREQPRGKKEVK